MARANQETRDRDGDEEDRKERAKGVRVYKCTIHLGGGMGR